MPHSVTWETAPGSRDFFRSLISEARKRAPVTVAVCWPCSECALEGAVGASQAQLTENLLIGRKQEIRAIADKLGLNLSDSEIVDVATEDEAAEKSVELCRDGRTQALMKGSLHTDLLMRHVLHHEAGLRRARRVSHVFVLEAPLYDRPLLISDGVINISPTLEEKIDIVSNAIDLAHAISIPEPKVAILSAIETVNPKIASTVDAAALCKMADRSQITGAILDGPLAFDTAVSEEAALTKRLKSPVAGKADILIAPDLESGNMLAKELEYLGGARMAGVVVGARVPIVLTSRADSAESRVASCAIASFLVC